jgi:hypothetical protein
MTEITLQTRLALDPRVRFRRFENDGIVIQQKTSEAIVVNEVATRLLEMTDGARTLGECARAIGAEFDAPEDVIEQELLHFAGELAEIGVVTVQP